MTLRLALVVVATACAGAKPHVERPSTAEQDDCRAFLRHVLELNSHPSKNMDDTEFEAYQANPQAHVDKACRDPEYLARKRDLPAKHVECLAGAKTSRELDLCYEQLTAEQMAADENAALAARKPCPVVTFADGTAAIRGRVTDGNQAPAMATVTAIESAFDGDTVEPSYSPSTVSDDKGEYTLALLC
jgi:hypothetical protein